MSSVIDSVFPKRSLRRTKNGSPQCEHQQQRNDSHFCVPVVVILRRFWLAFGIGHLRVDACDFLAELAEEKKAAKSAAFSRTVEIEGSGCCVGKETEKVSLARSDELRCVSVHGQAFLRIFRIGQQAVSELRFYMTYRD